jgi:PKD repeat protein
MKGLTVNSTKQLPSHTQDAGAEARRCHGIVRRHVLAFVGLTALVTVPILATTWIAATDAVVNAGGYVYVPSATQTLTGFRLYSGTSPNLFLIADCQENQDVSVLKTAPGAYTLEHFSFACSANPATPDGAYIFAYATDGVGYQPQWNTGRYVNVIRSGGSWSKISGLPPPSAPPVVDFSHAPASPVVGQQVTFTATGTNAPTTWEWFFGDSQMSALQNPTHVYANAGTFTVQLTAWNATGSSTISHDIAIATPTCSLSCSVSMPGTATRGVPFTYSGGTTATNCTGSPTSVLTFGDGNEQFNNGGTTVSGSYAYNTPGTYSWQFTVTQAGQTCTKSGQITVGGSTPAAAFDYTPGAPTTGQTVTFHDHSTNEPTAWNWDFGDSTKSTLQNPTHVFGGAKSFTVSLTATNASGANTITHNVTVGPSTTLQASFTVMPTPPVRGRSTSFTDTSTGGSSTRMWDFGDGSTSSEPSPKHTYAATGAVTVTLTARNGAGTSTARQNLTIVAPEQTPPGRSDLGITTPLSTGRKAILITHGYSADANSWVLELAQDFCARLGARTSRTNVAAQTMTNVCQQNGWDVWALDWSKGAATELPQSAWTNALRIGENVAYLLAKQHYDHIHLIAHSAGANVIENAALWLPLLELNVTTVHETFLDPYDPSFDATFYGSSADWSDNYVDTRPAFYILDGTKLFLTHAYTVDVTPPSDLNGCHALGSNLEYFECNHSRPYRFYGTTVATDGVFDPGESYTTYDPVPRIPSLGYSLSVEAGTSLDALRSAFPSRGTCHVVGTACQSAAPTQANTATTPVSPTDTRIETTTGSVNITPGTNGIVFQTLTLGTASTVTGRTTLEDTAAVASLSSLTTITQPANTLEFTWLFGAGGEGYLRFFVDDTLVREIDQRFLAPAPGKRERIPIGAPFLVPGVHRIAVRLDGFGTQPSSVVISDLELASVVVAPDARHRAVQHH